MENLEKRVEQLEKESIEQLKFNKFIKYNAYSRIYTYTCNSNY